MYLKQILASATLLNRLRFYLQRFLITTSLTFLAICDTKICSHSSLSSRNCTQVRACCYNELRRILLLPKLLPFRSMMLRALERMKE